MMMVGDESGQTKIKWHELSQSRTGVDRRMVSWSLRALYSPREERMRGDRESAGEDEEYLTISRPII